MAIRKPPQTKKVLDVSRPKKQSVSNESEQKAAEAAAAQLVIPKRSAIIQVSVDDDQPAQPESLQANRIAKNIEPLSEPGQKSDAEPKEAKADIKSLQPKPAKPEAKPEKTPEPETKPAPEPKPEPKPAVPPPAPEPEPKEEAPTEEPETVEKPAGGENNGPGPKTDAEVRKALEDAKRQEQIQGYIDKREFFVPINAVARKRSIKVTILLVLIELSLGMLLVNLMLDAGLIYLLEQIPHTNFFDLKN